MAGSSRVEVEASYLPFLLGGKEKEKEVEWRETSGKGGRRSFGGLNKDVEVSLLDLFLRARGRGEDFGASGGDEIALGGRWEGRLSSTS